MSGSRPSIFEDDDIDISGFAPKGEPTEAPVQADTVRQVSEASGFPSRSPTQRTAAAPKVTLKKSGRTVLLNARITQGAHDRFHAIVESERLRFEQGEIMHRPTLGEIVERALIALEREEQGRK